LHFGFTRVQQWMQNASMAQPTTVTLSIRHVPSEAHEVLVARAEAAGQSLQEYLLTLVQEHAAHPTRVEVLARIRARKARMRNGGVSDEAIQRALEESRNEQEKR
jgi:hypothetical protein